MELVINAKERRKFIIIPRGFLSKLNRSINIRVELIDRLKKKLLAEYFCDGNSKVCEINIMYIGPSAWRMLLARFLANALLVLTTIFFDKTCRQAKTLFLLPFLVLLESEDRSRARRHQS